ncbi:MAG TPA: HlyD family efflux transporter periplasmic adaptor subunit, partial [Acidimicrobiales bacterium]|nr:HlyD family efflux transporter periplasmic adaptor subunit [Acidimicrobiales bacterium]
PTSASFGSATTAAVEKLQAAVGLAQTGTLTVEQAVFDPTALRVTTLSVQPGSSSQAGQTVLQATSTTRQVQVALDAAQQTDVAVGDKVAITLPDNRTTPGVVASVGTVASCPPTARPDASTSTSAGPGTDSCSSGSAGSSTPTVAVVVMPSDPSATGTWDQAPVRVSVTTANVPDALAVPVTALLAESGGGYAVEVVGAGGASHLVPVSLGLFDEADGLVQVTNTPLAAGQDVVVPAI